MKEKLLSCFSTCRVMQKMILGNLPVSSKYYAVITSHISELQLDGLDNELIYRSPSRNYSPSLQSSIRLYVLYFRRLQTQETVDEISLSEDVS